MGEMAGFLATLCQRLPPASDVRSLGGKRKGASTSHEGESSDDQSDDSERFCKRRRQEDELSVHASEEDDDIKMLTEHSKTPQVNDQEGPETDDKFLKELVDSLDENEATGLPVQQQLADIANRRWGKNLSADKIKALIDRYKRPENCPDIVPIRVNNEIWATLLPAKKSADFQLANIQQTIRKVAFIILQTADELLPQTKGQANKDLATRVVDGIAMLGHVSCELSKLRRGQIRPALRPEISSICTADIGNGPLLFGSDLSKQLKEAKETNDIGQSLSSAPKKKYSTQRGKQYDNKRYNYNSTNRYNRAPKKDFFFARAKTNPTKEKSLQRRSRRNNQTFADNTKQCKSFRLFCSCLKRKVTVFM